MTDAAKELGEGEGILREAFDEVGHAVASLEARYHYGKLDREADGVHHALAEVGKVRERLLSYRTPPAPEREGEKGAAREALIVMARAEGVFGRQGRDLADRIIAAGWSLLAPPAAPKGEQEREEREQGATINERDAAEEALSQAYALVIGEHPEWSNQFGYREALEAIDERVLDLQRQAALSPKAESAPSAGAGEFAHKPWPQDYAALRIGLDRAYRDKRSSLYSDASKAIEWLSDRVWELQNAAPSLLAERDEARAERDRALDIAGQASLAVFEAKQRESAALAELEEAKRALEPFATLADRLPSGARDHDMARDYPATPLVGDLRRARAALSALSSAKGVEG